MFHWLLLLHRYLGLALGVLLTAWCLSGVVMMYVAYPSVSAEQQLAGLDELDLTGCCDSPHSGGVSGSTPIDDFWVEMLLDRPVVRVTTGLGQAFAIDLERGEALDGISAEQAGRIAADFLAQSGSNGRLQYRGPIEQDQWTIGFFRHGPLHHFALDDDAGTEWYLSSQTGEVVQITTATQRFWNWLGPIVHWLYPTRLRQHGAVWVQVVIWTSLLGCFLTLFGLYLGLVRLRRRSSGRWSPYRGLALWHHYLGVVFGVLTLTWLASGLLSVQPWGALVSEGFGAERYQIRDVYWSWSDIRERLAALAPGSLPQRTVRLQAAPFNGQLFFISHERDGSRQRLHGTTLKPAPLSEAALAHVAAKLRADRAIAEAGTLDSEDAYYFNHHTRQRFPVYRVILDDAERTRYYLDSVSGQLLRKIDSEARWYRWLFAGLHRIDFVGAVRQRPLWDVLMLVLMAGVTAVCFTGTWMGWRYLRRAFK